jgi:ribosomal protein S6--L-glutamate ligase
MCVKAAQILGLDYCGVDIIFQENQPYILELNGSPSWEGLKKATGISVAEEIASHVLRKVSLQRQTPYTAS